MNKKQFISILETRLSPLHPDERRELLSDVESHFQFGLQNGRSEEEIARELGDPFEMAREALGDRFTEAPVYLQRSPSGVGQLFIGIGLFFCALVAVPLQIGLWAGGIGIAAGAAAVIFSPVLVLIEYLYNGTFYPAKLFLSISFIGVGILLAYLVRWIFLGLFAMLRGYLRWNTRLLKGRTVQ
ncbi:Uncharacterized membrane protein [Paenibacillus uliginis N3/975]|uniref:Uncharacterized membrane protein n=1 Tax=Paenibacillus uliginis N3/975 TaxID=1313296 RepID=A0A1X7HB87_9BACL|nr:DUF1700 domain-containing protein [Paenibacillus uliginis]SMF82205.1 Uncharacterized membrane protein [Paenibacillus uliginis N3/975]